MDPFLILALVLVVIWGVNLARDVDGETEVEIAVLASDWDREHPWTERWNGHQITKLRERVRTGEIQAWEYEFELDELLAAEQPVVRQDTGVPTITQSRENPFLRNKRDGLFNEGEKARMVAEFARKHSGPSNNGFGLVTNGCSPRLNQPKAALPDSKKRITAYNLDGEQVWISVMYLARIEESTPGAMIFHLVDGTSEKLWLKPPDQLVRNDEALVSLLTAKQLAKGGPGEVEAA